MRIMITGRHVEITAALRRYIETRMKRMGRYGIDLGNIQVSLAVEKFRHTAEVVCTFNGKTIQASASTAVMYTSIDQLADKAEVQVRKLKERLVNHKPNIGRKPRSRVQRGERSPSSGVKVIQPVVKRLTLAEAIECMDEEPLAVLVFVNVAIGQMQVLQRLPSGGLVLIDPQGGLAS